MKFTVLYILFVIVILGILIYNSPDFRRNRKMDRYIFNTPAIFTDNTEYANLVDLWRDIEKMDSWKPETKIAEENLMFQFREFIEKGSDTSDLLQNPMVQLAQHNAKILVDTHYDITDLNRSLSQWQNSQIRHVISRDTYPKHPKYPKELEIVIREFLNVYLDCDTEGRLFCIKEYKRLQEKHFGLADNLPVQ